MASELGISVLFVAAFADASVHNARVPTASAKPKTLAREAAFTNNPVECQKSFSPARHGLNYNDIVQRFITFGQSLRS